MNTQAGVWIDHRKALVVLITEAGETLQEIPSDVEKHVRFSGGTGSEDGSTEDIRDRQFQNHLNSYYDEVIAVVKDANPIQLFGPGHAVQCVRVDVWQPPDRSWHLVDGSVPLPNGSAPLADGCAPLPNGNWRLVDGRWTSRPPETRLGGKTG